ncbi:MAG: RcnB family protein [Gammaproteobacteria bacterium]
MNRTTLIGTLVASLAVGSAALADPRDHGNGRGHDYDHRSRPQAHQAERRDYRHDYRNDNRYDNRYSDRHDYRAAPYRSYAYRAPPRYDSYYRPHGFYEHRWLRGERLPVAYYEPSYVIGDYDGYGLYSPPRGHHWVRVDGDAVLAAVATGIVLDTVIHAFH